MQTDYSIFTNSNGRKVIRIGDTITLLSRYIYQYFKDTYLNTTDVIHHIDEDKTNDCINNLKKMNKDEHKILHNYKERY